MFVVTLRFSANKAQAPALMQAHNDWIRDGFDDGVFLMTGSLKPGLGGVVLAHGVTRDEIEARVGKDPFVAEDVVSADILEIAPGRTDDRLAFLMG
ncbi:MAG TPA: YciI family protein [Bosea sp. (in: a-proteobacteria)]